MTSRHRHRARGVALLVVLAALVVTTTALLGLVQVTATASIDRSLTSRRQMADDFLASADLAARRWLSEKAALVILPPDVTNASPGVDVFDSEWSVPDRGRAVRCRLTITAWDQCAAIPIAILESGGSSALRSLAPIDPDQTWTTSGATPPLSPGLDFFAMQQGSNQLGVRVFPLARNTHSPSRLPSLGGWGGIATHNPFPTSLPPEAQGDANAENRSHATFRINVCTAPMPLIEAALRETPAGATAIYASILTARSQGRRPNIGLIATADQSEDPERRKDGPGRLLAPEFATFSNCWSLRIDTAVGPVRKSWWVVYVQNSSTWECAQRLVIDE